MSAKRPGTARARQISVKSNLVLLPVSVIDSSGGFVSGLQQDNFQVLENSKLQTITFFRQEDTPVTVGLLVDHSESMGGAKLDEVAAAASVFARSSNAEDEMFVVNFGNRVSIEPHEQGRFTSDAADLEQMVKTRNTGGQTALYDAVAAGLDYLRLGHRTRKALVVVSDGGDDASRHNYREVSALARQSQAMIYCIGLIGGLFEEQSPSVLRRLAQETGGVAYFPSDLASVATISREIARDLRELYTIGYVPEMNRDGGQFRKIKVQVVAGGRSKVHVRTRLGYSLAPTSNSAMPKGDAPW